MSVFPKSPSVVQPVKTVQGDPYLFIIYLEEIHLNKVLEDFGCVPSVRILVYSFVMRSLTAFALKKM